MAPAPHEPLPSVRLRAWPVALPAALMRRTLHAALAAFDDGGGGEWRLSLVSDLRGRGVETAPRRFTFLLGPGDGRRTPRERIYYSY